MVRKADVARYVSRPTSVFDDFGRQFSILLAVHRPAEPLAGVHGTLGSAEPWLKTTEIRSSWHDKDMNRAVSGAWAAKLPLIAYLYLPCRLPATFPLNCCGHNPRRQSLTEYTWSTCQSTLSNSDKICAFLSLCNNALSLPSNEKRQSLKHSVCSYATTTTTEKFFEKYVDATERNHALSRRVSGHSDGGVGTERNRRRVDGSSTTCFRLKASSTGGGGCGLRRFRGYVGIGQCGFSNMQLEDRMKKMNIWTKKINDSEQ